MASQLRLLSHSPVPDLEPVGGSGPLDDWQPHRAHPRLQSQGPGVDLDSLRCFDAVATTLRFRSAASRVHLSPAAFSDRIRRLEESLGARVLLRTTRVVTLTETGKRLLPLARRILGLVACLPGTASGVQEPAPYEFLVGARSEVGASWLCDILDPLTRKRPERTIHLYDGSSGDLLTRIERGELDAVITSMRFNSSRLTYAALHTEKYLLVGVDRHLRCREDARRLTLVDISPDLPMFRYFLDAQPDAEPWPFARIEYMGGIENLRHRLLTGGGRVGVLPALLTKQDLAKKRLRRLMPRVALRSDSLRLIWRTDHPRQADLLTLAHDLRTFPLR